MKSNTKLWDAVCTTDPEMTSRVNQRGGFTAIDAYYTVQRLTEQFGPLGHGWGWDATFTIDQGAVICTAYFWSQIDGKRSSSVPILTMNKLMQGNGIDEDAGKKALTDAITKWASYLGFSADVFLGKFDDNKYVDGLRKSKGQKPETAATKAERWTIIRDAILACDDIGSLQNTWKNFSKELIAFNRDEPETYGVLERHKEERKQQIIERAGFPPEFNKIS